MQKTNSDGCSDVICDRHGFLGRSLSGASSILCKGCGRWIRAESPEMRKLRDRDRDKKRARRAQALIVNQDATVSPL